MYVFNSIILFKMFSYFYKKMKPDDLYTINFNVKKNT